MPGLSSKGKLRFARLWRAEVPDHVAALAWSPDGSTLAAAAVSGPVALVDTGTGEVRHRLAGHDFGTTSLVWLDPDTVVTGGQDDTVRFWDRTTGKERLALAAGAWVERLALSPCGTYLAASAGRKVLLWERDGKLAHEFADHASTVVDIAWRPGTLELAAAAYGSVTLWSPGRAVPTGRFEWKGSVLRLCWSPDGKYLATGDQDSTVHFWLAATGEDLQMSGYPTKVRELAWDPGSRFLATGGGAQVTVWDCSGAGPEGTTPLSLVGHDPETPIWCLAYQRQGPHLVSGGADGFLVLWRPERGKVVQARTEFAGGVAEVAWSPDDTRLAAGTQVGEIAAFQL